MIDGVDSAYPPSAADAAAAYTDGCRWWGFYLNGVDGDEDPLNTWTAAQVQVLVQAGCHPVPIWVPKPDLSSDPVEAANESFTAATACGLAPTVSVLYNGNHIAATGPVWLPIPGPKPSAVGAMSAIQYGQTTYGATSVDLNVAAADFPMSAGIVCDFEYNTDTTKGPAWYQAFQHRIHLLGEPMTSAPLPAGAYPIKATSGITWTTPAENGMGVYRAECVLLGADGVAYHKVFVPGTGWSYENIGAA